MNNLVLYRKYRPQNFAEIVGQEHITRTLQNALVQNKVAHAYLFAGPRGSGKTTIARILAKAINCMGRAESPEPCNKCANCLDSNLGQALDLMEIDAASNRGIDEIKSLRENVRFGPSLGKYKIYLIDEAHMLTKEAFNAFLKTLEEPPAHAIFILATTEAHRLLPTIISRTQRFDFKRLSPAELTRRLNILCQKENVAVEPEALKLIAYEADGSARDAEGLLGQILATGENKITLGGAEEILGLFSHRKIKDFVSLAINKNQNMALNWLHKTMEAGYDVNQLLKSLNHYIRKLIMVGVSAELAQMVKMELAEDDFKILQDQSKKTSPVQLAGWLKTFSETKKNLDHYPLPQMALEIALINLLSDGSIIDNKPRSADVSPIEISNDSSSAEATQGKQFLISNQAPMSNDRISKLEIPVADPKPDTLNLVLSKWQDIINEVRPYNHSVSGFLIGMKPKEATLDSLTLATKYTFHRDRLSEHKNKKIIEDAVEKIIGKRLALNFILEK